MSNRHQVSVGPITPTPGPGAETSTATAVVSDNDHSDLAISFQFLVQPTGKLRPVGMDIHVRPDCLEKSARHLGAGALRDLPIARWERVARTATTQVVGGGRWIVDQTSTPDAIVRRSCPGLDPSSGPGAARRWRRLVRLVSIVQQHQAAGLQGSSNPAAQIALKWNVPHSTIRGWLHQAKLEGITS